METGSDGVALSVQPERPRLDEVPEVRATGLPAGSEATVRATTAWNDRTLDASATFRVDADGVVDLGTMAPDAGAYAGVDAAGLLWAAEPNGDAAPSRETPAVATTTYSVERDGDVLANESVARVVKPDGVTRADVDAAGVPADLYRPPSADATSDDDDASDGGGASAPGVVLLGGSEGGRARSPVPWLLADEGYPVLAPAYVGEDDSPASELVEVPVDAVADAVEWFASHETDSGSVVVVGRSRGSELAGLLAERVDAIEGVVGVAPSGVAFEGLDANNQTAGTSAWAVDGDPTAFVPVDDDAITAPPIEIADAYVGGLDATDDAAVADAELLAEFDGTVSLVAGEDDRMWHSATLAERFADRLRGDGARDVDVRVTLCADAGHAIGVPGTHATGRALVPAGPHDLALGGTPEGYARADREHWTALLDALGETGDEMAGADR